MKSKRKIGILTGGGDTPPLNTVIFALRDRLAEIGVELIGFLKGWEGVLEGQYVEMGDLPNFCFIGGTILKSSRVNLGSLPNGLEKVNRVLAEMGLSALVVIGGDDTLSNVYEISTTPCLLISKTIDNDVGKIEMENGDLHMTNFFTLGYPTAANKIARFVSLEEGIRTTAYSHERVLIVESMGMQAGWLALASGLGNPDFIIIPEFPLEYEEFLVKLKKIYQKQKHAIVVVAEGAKYGDGTYIYADSREADAFRNPRFGGASGVLRDRLKEDLFGFMNVRNINAVNPSYWYRSGAPDALDILASHRIAERCVQLISKNEISEHQFIGIAKTDSGFEAEAYPLGLFPETQSSRFPKRFVDSSLYDGEKWQVSPLGEKYLSCIVSFRSKALSYIQALGVER